MASNLTKDLEEVLKERVAKGKDLLKVMSSENLKIATFFYQFALIIEEAYNIKKSLKDTLESGSKSSEGECILCGYTTDGTQRIAMDQVSESLIAMNAAFHDMSDTLKTKSKELQKYPNPEDKKAAEKCLDDTQGPINDIQMLKVVISKSTAGLDKRYQKALDKVNDTTLSLIKKSQPTDRQKKPINENFPIVLEARSKTASQKALLCQKGNAAIDQFKGLLQKFAQFSQTRNDTFRELFDIAMYAYMKIAAIFQDSASKIEEKAKNIDPIADLRTYSKIRGIVRYDLTIQPFEEFQCHTPAFESLESKINVSLQPKFDPIGFVKVIHSFRAENENEMNCVRGKRLLLLEKMQGDWTFVMHPITRVTGFVPTQCIEPIGKALGIVLRKQNGEISESIMIRAGEYVAITDVQSLKFETMRGEKCNKAPANLIGIVYQDY